ncbi:zinc ribbon domain-containing protein [Oligoflexia bacterium]|nr:zinc ribbon domain-containing protein [Oligoflexia bacterium]
MTINHFYQKVTAMPIYEFQCADCNHKFEVLMRNDAEHPEKCPACGAPAPEKQLSGFAVGEAAPAQSASPCARCPSNPHCPRAK